MLLFLFSFFFQKKKIFVRTNKQMGRLFVFFFRMDLPVRCFSCGSVLHEYYRDIYQDALKTSSDKEAFQKLKDVVHNECCVTIVMLNRPCAMDTLYLQTK